MTSTSTSSAPKGQFITVGPYNAYFTEASPNSVHKESAILYVSDVFGIWSESQLRADNFAAEGYTTLVLDLFAGDKIHPDEIGKVDIKAWISNGRHGTGPHTSNEVDPIIESGIKFLKEQNGFKHVGAVGYSFGARFVVRHYKNGIDAGFLAYPSFVEEEEFAAITGPISIAAAETDDIFPTELRVKTEEILKGTGRIYQLTLYSGVVHGFFSAEHDLTGTHAKHAQEQSFVQALNFFNYFLV